MHLTQDQNKFQVSVSTLPNYAAPLVTRERFAEMIGLPPGVILGWANKGLLPQVKIGRYALVNVELLKKQCLAKEFV